MLWPLSGRAGFDLGSAVFVIHDFMPVCLCSSHLLIRLTFVPFCLSFSLFPLFLLFLLNEWLSVGL